MGSASDLVVSNGDADTVQVFVDGTATGFPTTAAATITGSTVDFGAFLFSADFNGDGKNDIGVSDQGTASNVWVFYNHTNSFDPNAATAGFHQSLLSGTALFGYQVAVGDFDNNGKPDIAVGDATDGVGKVTVWHP